MLELFTSERRAREKATIGSHPTELMDIILKNLKADFNLQEITEDFINEYRCEKGRFESYKDDDDYEAAEEEEEIIEIEAESRKHCKVSAENWRIVEWGNCNDCFDLNFNGDSFLSSDTIGIKSLLEHYGLISVNDPKSEDRLKPPFETNLPVTIPISENELCWIPTGHCESRYAGYRAAGIIDSS